MNQINKTTVLMILDGYGLNPCRKGNAVAQANTPHMDRLMKNFPFVPGDASGLAVGLPEGQMGNSEVGHMNMGAGRVVYQDLTRISKEIAEGTFFENQELLLACRNAKEKGKALHLFGLLSDGGVHSHKTHLFALLELAKRENLDKVFIHCFLDGRDTLPGLALPYLEELEEKCRTIGVGQVSSLIGRYYVMDRDHRWERVEPAYRTLTKGEGKHAISAREALQESFASGVTDEFVEPITIVDQQDKPIALVEDGDSIIFYNFRPDRAREITRAFLDEEFHGFSRELLQDLTYVCFTEYDVTIPHTHVAFRKQELSNTLGTYLAEKGKKQLRLAETEKYAHVTFFFNGGVEAPNDGEDRILIPSPKVATYDLQPEMSAYAVCDQLVEAIEGGKYDLIIINFANPDMVGHTGSMEAAIAAVEAVDSCVGRAVKALEETGGQMFLCADHGNAEQMIQEKSGEPFTAHTTNQVPFVLVHADPSYRLKEGGRLCDIAPTLLELMGLPKPEDMTGQSLLQKV